MDSKGDRRLRVAVIMGGQSAERDVSVRTGRTVVRELGDRYLVKPVEILASGRWLAPAGFVGHELGADPAGWPAGDGAPILDALCLLREAIDVAFNGLHGPLGEDGTIQGLFRMVGIPLTGPDVIPSAVTMDKRLTKLALIGAGIRTPRFFSVPAAEAAFDQDAWSAAVRREAPRLPFPWIVKPVRLGSSVGVAIFRSPAEAEAGTPALARSWPASALQEGLLVEEVVGGRELTCGVLEVDGRAEALPPIEIRPRGQEFFDYHAKYVPGASDELCPAPLTPEETGRVQETALAVHRLLECAPLSRTDMFLTPAGHLEVLEVNTLPGMTETSLIPLSASRRGLALADLLSSLVDHALARARAREAALGPAIL